MASTADYAHRADQSHARKLERAARMLASWTDDNRADAGADDGSN
jgi:hypothetical protein